MRTGLTFSVLLLAAGVVVGLMVLESHARREMFTPKQRELLGKVDRILVETLALTDKGEVGSQPITEVVGHRLGELDYTIVTDSGQAHDVVFRVKCEQRKVWEGMATSGGDADLPDSPSRIWKGPACQLTYLLRHRNLGWRKEVRTDFQDSVRAAAQAGASDPGAYALAELVEKLETYDFPVLVTADWRQADRLLRLLDAEGVPTERKIRIITALGTMFAESAAPRLVKATDDPNVSIATAATLSLGEIGKSETIPLMVELLKSDKPELQAAAARALGQIGALNFDYSMVDPLIETLQTTEDVRVKTAVVWSLGKLPDKRSYEPLIRLQQELPGGSGASTDPDAAELRDAVAWSLRQITPGTHTYE